jgi:hypothetical protein
MAVAQQPQRAHHVGMALARDQVPDADDDGLGGNGRRLRWQVGAEVHDAHLAGAGLAAALCDRGRVGEHEPGAREGAPDRGASGPAARRGVVEVAAVLGDDERRAGPRAQRGVGRRHGIVGVHEVEGEATPKAPQRQRERPGGPRAPGAVAARTRR